MNKVYVVQVLHDINSIYNGLDDTRITVCNDYDAACEKLNMEFQSALEYFKICDEIDSGEYNIIEIDNYFSVDDDCNYISGRILEMEVV